MDRFRQWLSENIAESELSNIGRQVVQLIRQDIVVQRPRILLPTDQIASSNSNRSVSEGCSNLPLSNGISEKLSDRNNLTTRVSQREMNEIIGLSPAEGGSLEEDERSEVDDIFQLNEENIRESQREMNEVIGMSSVEGGSSEEDEPSEVDDILQLNEDNHDCERIQSTTNSKEILNGGGKLLTHPSEVGDHSDRALECSAEELVLSGVVSPEELQDVNNIIAEPDIFFCDVEEFTKTVEPNGKNIKSKQGQGVTEVLVHTAINSLPVQSTTNKPVSQTMHRLNVGSASSVCECFPNNRAVTDASSLKNETRNDTQDLTSDMGNFSFTEERDFSADSPGSSLCSTAEPLGNSSDKEVAHSETFQGIDKERMVQAENGIKLSNTKHLGVWNDSEGFNMCENTNQDNSLTEIFQGSPSMFKKALIPRNQQRSLKHFLHNASDELHQSGNSKIKTKKLKVVMKQLNIKDMFTKRAEEDNSLTAPQNMKPCVSETNQKPVPPKKNSTEYNAKSKCDIVENDSMSSKNDTLENVVRVKKHKKNSFKVPLKSFPFPEVKRIEETRKEIIGSESVFLDDITASELEERLYRAEPLEIGMTLVYRGGFCDLNKPTGGTVVSAHKAIGVLLRIKVSQSEFPNFYYISFDENDWKEFATPKLLLKTVLSHACQKICFCAQDFMMELIKRFHFSRSEVCLKWILLDPLIGCWLLNPDKSFYFFSEVSAALGLKESSSPEDGPSHTKLSSLPQAMENLSLSAILLYQKLEKAGLWRLFLDIEMKLVSILAVMETRGICTNTKELQEMQIMLHKHLNNLQEQAYKEAGKQFQLNSPQQLRNILYEELQLDRKSNTKVRETAKLGQKSTSEHMLSLLKSCHPLPGTVLQYRHLQKIKSTFVDSVLQQIVEGKVFPSWGQHCAATGRITSSNPNLQAIPKQPVVLKILPDDELTSDKTLLLRLPYHSRDGYTLVSADFQHIELRMLAHLSKDPLLIEILQKSDDIFTSMSRIWLGKTDGTIESEDREKTKRIVYAVMYGAGPAKLSEFLNIGLSEASSIINSFLAHFPAIKKFSNAVVKECEAKECLHTITGRHRLFPNIKSSNSGLKSYTERQAVNFLMQGSAADICKCAMIHTELEFLKNPELDVHLLIQIHDELVWEVKDEHVDIVKDIIRKSMEDCSNVSEFQIQISVPLPVIVKRGKDWSNMQDVYL